MNYKPTIGLEIHARLFTEKKIFCSCDNSFGGEANTRICPVCTGVKGALPVLNPEAVELGIKAGLVLGCEICEKSAFDRKNYKSADLPKGYQITQQFRPFCKNGGIYIMGKKRRINNIHLEEDAAKITYSDGGMQVDYNRSGTPLIEIVTEPDFETSDEVSKFVEELALRLKYAGVCDGKIEQGSLRVDVNISVAPEASSVFGTRCEIKNIGSLKSLRRAIDYEVNRQISVLENGEEIRCETRRFNESEGITEYMRLKESAEDYGYYPDPDMPELCISCPEIQNIKKQLPEMPSDRVDLYTAEYGLATEEAENIVSDRAYADWFESVCTWTGYRKKAASLMLVGMNRLFNKHGGSVAEIRFTPRDLAELAELWGTGKISSASAFAVLEEMFVYGGKPLKIAEQGNMVISFDKDVVKKEILCILSEHSSAVCDYKSGNKKIFGFLMGIAVERMGKSANPADIKNVLEECIVNL